jgi:hypothetical protein
MHDIRDIEDRLRGADRVPAPELWDEVEERATRVPQARGRTKIAVGGVALLLAVASMLFLLRAFRVAEPVSPAGDNTASGGPLASAWTVITDPERGFSVRVPDDWLITPVQSASSEPLPLFVVGTELADLSGNCETMLGNVHRDGAFVYALEEGAGAHSWPPRSAEYGPGMPEGSDWDGCVGTAYAVSFFSFIDQGRAMYILVVVGPEADEETEAQAWGVVNSLQLEPVDLVGPTIVPADGWDTLVSLAPGDSPPVAWTSNERLSLDDGVSNPPLYSINALTGDGVLVYVAFPFAKDPAQSPEQVAEWKQPVTLDVLQEQLTLPEGVEGHVTEYAGVGKLNGYILDIRVFLGRDTGLEPVANAALARVRTP